MKTLEFAKELLVSLYKREIDNYEYYQTQNQFDVYVQEFCKSAEIEESEITDDQLNECADNFIQYDGGEYLIKENNN